MKIRIVIFLLVVLSACLLSSCTDTNKPEASDRQSLKIIIFHGLNYRVTDEKISHQSIEQKVGAVKSYSNKSGEHYVVDAFSNAFQLGTELYKIKDKDVKAAIAVKTEDTYLKAIRR